MGVKLRIAKGQAREQFPDVGLVHPRILEEAENDASVADSHWPEYFPGAARKQVVNKSVNCAITPLAGSQARIQPKGIKGQPHSLDSQAARVLHQDAENSRMQMEMEVAVDMVQDQAGGA